jgi:sulfite reductase (NADPH) hemoprotein beta-component
MAGGRLARKGPSIPVLRAIAAVERIVATYQSNRVDDERFFTWVHRQADAYFNELLADLVAVQPEAVEGLLQDYGEATDFKPAQLGGGECAGAAQVFIGAAFFAAAHERRYRDAFYAQHRVPQALECARNDIKLIAQGIYDLLNPAASFKVKKTFDDLAELASALAAKAPTSIVLPLEELSIELAPVVRRRRFRADRPGRRLFAKGDAWIQEAAAFCTAQDPQLDLYGALPNDRRSGQPIVFQRRRRSANAAEATAPAFSSRPAENEVYEPMVHG